MKYPQSRTSNRIPGTAEAMSAAFHYHSTRSNPAIILRGESVACPARNNCKQSIRQIGPRPGSLVPTRYYEIPKGNSASIVVLWACYCTKCLDRDWSRGSICVLLIWDQHRSPGHPALHVRTPFPSRHPWNPLRAALLKLNPPWTLLSPS